MNLPNKKRFDVKSSCRVETLFDLAPDYWLLPLLWQLPLAHKIIPSWRCCRFRAHKSSSELFFLSNLVLGFRVISKITVIERGRHLSMNRLSIRSRGCERSFVPLCCVPCRAARSGTGTWRGAMLERPASAPSPLSVGCGRPRGRARGLSERLARTTVMAARGAARWQLPVDPVLAWLVQHIGAAGHPGRPRWRMKRVGVPVLRGPTLSFV